MLPEVYSRWFLHYICLISALGFWVLVITWEMLPLLSPPPGEADRLRNAVTAWVCFMSLIGFVRVLVLWAADAWRDDNAVPAATR